MKKYMIMGAIIAVLILLTACGSNKETDAAVKINQDTLQIKDFEVSTDLVDSNTVAYGNVYVRKSDDDIIITLVASIVIGENDWGGVSFYIPQGWNISNALSSYPDGSSVKSDNNAVILSTTDTTSEWKSYVEIGHELNQTPTGGGTGTVFIELTSDENTSISDGFSLLVSVGSELKDGAPIVGTASTSIQLDIDPVTEGK